MIVFGSRIVSFITICELALEEELSCRRSDRH